MDIEKCHSDLEGEGPMKYKIICTHPENYVSYLDKAVKETEKAVEKAIKD